MADEPDHDEDEHDLEVEARLEAVEHDLELARASMIKLIRAVELLDARVGEWESDPAPGG